MFSLSREDFQNVLTLFSRYPRCKYENFQSVNVLSVFWSNFISSDYCSMFNLSCISLKNDHQTYPNLSFIIEGSVFLAASFFLFFFCKYFEILVFWLIKPNLTLQMFTFSHNKRGAWCRINNWFYFLVF